MNKTTDTPRTDALMVNGCIAINILEHARTLERELNNTPPPAPSGEVWPEISRLRERIAEQEEARKKAEAEVERLKSQLARAVEIAEIGIKYITTGGEWDSEAFPKDTGWVTDEEIEDWQRKLAELKGEIK